VSIVDPSKVEHWQPGAQTWDDADFQADITTGVTDDTLDVTVMTLIISPTDDVARVEFSGLATIAVGDTIRVHSNGDPSSTQVYMFPYDGAISVDIIQIDVPALTDDWSVLTFTQTFIDALYDQGGGTFAIRLWAIGFPLSEVEADLTLSSTEQEGYRWRDDDADEDEATWLADQDNDITRAKSTNTRLRTLIDATDDAPSQQATLQYRKVGDPASEWRDMPT